ncbi:19420_t:CDS:2, partial [Funneliformis geosporum]
LNQSDDIGKSDHVLGKRRNDDEEGSYQEGYTTSPRQKNIDEDNTSDIPDMPDISEEIDGGDQSSGTIYNDPRDVSLSLISIMEEYCKKDSTSKFDPAHSYILDLTATSKIIKEFTPEHWSKLVADRPDVVNVEYHKELDSIFDYLFGQQKGRWKNLRNIEPPEYKEEFSYDKDDWEKILWWIEWAVGR